jgi:RNA polymerase-binding transcription factor DksA
MATKKKAAKPAKKTIIAKKPAGKPAAKKAVAKKPTKPAPKKAAPKPVAKKAVPAKPAPKKVAPPAKPVVAVKPMDKKNLKPLPQGAAKPNNGNKPVAPVAKPAEPVKPHEVKKQDMIKKTNQPNFPPVPVKRPTVPSKPVKVVIPEMKTKTVRKYEPEFTKSVLDQPDNIQTGPTMRYSDAELVEFKDLILKKLDQAKKELTYLQGLITRKDEMGGDENENRYMTMEDGSMSMEREQLSQMASRQINYIDHLEKALMRIENKTYGICRVTGKLIDKARLRAVPHATLSIEAKQMMNK